MATESHSVALGYAERNRGTFSFGGSDGGKSMNGHGNKKESVASQLADRNRQGTMGGVISMGGSEGSPKHNGTKKTGTPNTRCNTADARRNAERNQGQGVRGVFGTPDEDGSGNHTARIRPEGKMNADKHKGTLSMDMHDYTDNKPKGRVTSSGKIYADRNLGTLSSGAAEPHDDEDGASTPRRIRGNEAAKNAESSQGSISEVFKHNVNDCDVRGLKIA